MTPEQIAETLKDCVELHPDRAGGAPTIRGTRITVAQFLGELADGDNIGEIADRFRLDVHALEKILHGLSVCLPPSPKGSP